MIPASQFTMRVIALSTICASFARADHATKPEVVWRQGQEGRQAIVAFSPDGRSLAVGTAEVRILRAADGALQRDMGLHLKGGAGVLTIAFSPDGRFLAASDGYGVTRLWRVRDGH